MKTLIAKAANTVSTWFAKRMATTGCLVGCHAPEAPEELFSK